MELEYIFHTTKNHGRIAILPPTIEDVLSDNFNYPDYIEKYAKQNSELDDIDYLDKLYFKEPIDQETHMRSPLEDILVDEGLHEAYENDMRNIQRKYEEDLSNKIQTINYNEEMKKVAQNYYNQIVTNQINHQGIQK